MATVNDVYIGKADETTYGTAVTATQFIEFLSEGVAGKYERIESAGLRAGSTVQRTDRWVPNPKGASGDLKFEVLDNGLDFFLKHMTGAATTAAPVGGFATTTATIGDLAGKSFSLEVGRWGSAGGGTLYPFKFAGGKITSWELSNQTDGVLQATLSTDFASEAVGTIATPTYAVNGQLLTFAGGQVLIGGTAFAVTDVSLKMDNGLKTDRYALRGTSSTTKREPLSEGMRNVTFDIKGEFEDMTQVNRVMSTTAAGATATMSLIWDSPQGGELKVDLPFARFDDRSNNVDGAKVADLGLTGVALTDGSSSAVTLTYKAKQ